MTALFRLLALLLGTAMTLAPAALLLFSHGSGQLPSGDRLFNLLAPLLVIGLAFGLGPLLIALPRLVAGQRNPGARLAAALLLLVLSSQLLYHFRTELSIRVPSLSAGYSLAGVAVPLPRHADRVAIESSDLQSDNARGLIVLQATLQNRADYAQDWPALELTMTDTHDTVVTRKVLLPADYLPPGTPTDAFAANGELAVRLWIEAKDIGAAGYRLFVFYP